MLFLFTRSAPGCGEEHEARANAPLATMKELMSFTCIPGFAMGEQGDDFYSRFFIKSPEKA
jgi:hypothetical protein